MARSKKIDRVVEALLTSSTVVEAAEKSKVSVRTIFRWLRESSEFQNCLSAARKEAFGHGTGRIAALFGKGIDILKRALDGETVSKMEFLAAKLTIEACREIQADDLETRVAELEQRLRDRRDPSRRYANLTQEELETRLQIAKQKALDGFTADELRQRLRQVVTGSANDDTG